MSADSNETPKSKTGENSDQFATIKSELDSKLSEVQKQLEAMNQTFAESISAVAAANRPAPAREEIDDADVFDAKSLSKKVEKTAETIARDLLAEERRKNTAIYQMAQEYPEIHTDRELQKAILSAQKSLPKQLQDSAEGYEMAVLKAVAQQGLVAKSKRPEPRGDEDFSAGSGRSPSRGESRRSARKVSENTLAVAELLRGRALTDEEKASLEKAANRDTYGRYR